MSGYRRKDLLPYEPSGTGPRRRRRSSGPKVGIVGAGRAGLGLALAFKKARVRVLGVHGRREKPVPDGVILTVGPVAPWLADADVIVLAVGDDALGPLVEALAATAALRPGQTVLHLSGARTSEALAPLTPFGVAIGTMHPLMTVSQEPERAAKHFRGATFALEGEFEAVRIADALVRALGGLPAMIPPETKAQYHAGAVFASNYLVTALDAAERLLERAGIAPEVARQALVPLARATLENVAAMGPGAALTGPVLRGDAATVRRHRAALGPDDRRLYDALARATMALAKSRGLSPAAEAALLAALAEGPSPSG